MEEAGMLCCSKLRGITRDGKNFVAGTLLGGHQDSLTFGVRPTTATVPPCRRLGVTGICIADDDHEGKGGNKKVVWV